MSGKKNLVSSLFLLRFWCEAKLSPPLLYFFIYSLLLFRLIFVRLHHPSNPWPYFDSLSGFYHYRPSSKSPFYNSPDLSIYKQMTPNLVLVTLLYYLGQFATTSRKYIIIFYNLKIHQKETLLLLQSAFIFSLLFHLQTPHDKLSYLSYLNLLDTSLTTTSRASQTLSKH